MGRLVSISNRTTTEKPNRSGGLAVGLWESLRQSHGVWCGWSGEVKESPGYHHFTKSNIEFLLKDLTEEAHQYFYLSYANKTLWPILHYRLDLAQFDERAFEVYENVNRDFAKFLQPQLREDDIIWVHDYHFMLLGEQLHEFGVKNPIGFFLHVPFPAPEVFRAIPEHGVLGRALCHFDLVGFQTEQDRRNFACYLGSEWGGLALPDNKVTAFGQITTVKAFPIGIDGEDYAQTAQGEAAQKASKKLQHWLGDRSLIIGVDRMDYTKGLPERFQALGDLFDTNPDLCGRLSFTQIAPPSRSKLDAYMDLREQLDRLAGRINGEHGDLDWIPIRYLARGYGRDELAGLYRLARACLVTPLRDGMNLVAKEFVAAQNKSDPGVLILSEFAGAAAQMEEALIVNPHDISAVSVAIRLALEMPKEERIGRWKSLWDSVKNYSALWWQTEFLDELRNVSKNGTVNNRFTLSRSQISLESPESVLVEESVPPL